MPHFAAQRETIAKGFTAIEFLVVIAVSITVLLIVVSGLASFRRSADLSRTADEVISQLRDARRQTIESKNASQWGVHIEISRATLFEGTVFVPGAPDNVAFSVPSTLTISSISLQGGGADVVFKRISGDTDQYGTLVLSSVQNTAQTKTIKIYSSGLVEAQ